MVTAGKVFKIAEAISLPDTASKLKGFKTEEDLEEGDYKFTLVTEMMIFQRRKTLLQEFTPTTTCSTSFTEAK